jgi:hypothetical protein
MPLSQSRLFPQQQQQEQGQENKNKEQPEKRT